ncbi:Os06g0568101 [Oryza sativa Japonica Group]|uniref:Os06g0568101 protein n=1 Tax=Oryza sativa subsp. japonica TaxID=39947 RepID=A0A0P0WXZ3_ORYSJ|nr:Os06g0568101 [Oryza sativa Japonica Group]
MGIWVMEPDLPSIRPARSYMVARSVYIYPGYPRLPGTSSRAANTSRSASAYELISVKMTSTCFPHSYAKYSAVVSAIRGVMIRSMVGSFAYSEKG